jgi:hypothetical protein
MSDATQTGANPMDDFVQMSALLTGFAAGTIAPSLDPVNLKQTLFEAARKGAGAAFDELLAEYAKLDQQIAGGKPVADMTPEERRSIGEQLLDPGSDSGSQARAATAQSVMRLWYLGYWYPIEAGAFESVVSDQAYIRGLAWQVMQSHAMGYSPWTYGYWTEEPPPLTDFTGNPAPPEPSGAAEKVLAPIAAKLRPALSRLGQGKGGRSASDFAASAEAGGGGGRTPGEGGAS